MLSAHTPLLPAPMIHQPICLGPKGQFSFHVNLVGVGVGGGGGGTGTRVHTCSGSVAFALRINSTKQSVQTSSPESVSNAQSPQPGMMHGWQKPVAFSFT